MIPGEYIDLQINGYAGVDFSSHTLDIDGILHTAKLLKDLGTSAFFATMITSPIDIYEKNLPILATGIDLTRQDPDCAQVSGIHVEGPFISPQDGARGVHPKKHIQSASKEMLNRLIDLSEGNIRMITLAPEIDGGLELIEFASSLGIKVSIGHTMAREDTIKDAVKSGARFSTHLGNGIPQYIHRHNNPLWSQLANPDLVPMIIADGHHLPFEFIQVVLEAKGINNVIVVSDSSPAAGLPPGDYHFFGGVSRLDPGGKLYEPSTGYLAGSSATMSVCATWLSFCGMGDRDITRLTSLNARNLVIDTT